MSNAKNEIATATKPTEDEQPHISSDAKPILTEEHRTRLISKYGIPENRVDEWVENGVLSSVDKDEAERLTGWHNLLSGGILIRYLDSDAILIRLDKPVPNEKGKLVKYLSPRGQPCALFNPGVDLATTKEIYITEGPFKAICGFEHGIPIVALSGLWNWKNRDSNGKKVSDEEGLLPGLKRDLTGTKFVLLTDSDIVPGHKAYEDGAFPRLANALYHCGAEEVRVVALPNLTPDTEKTGLDEFILAKGDQAKPELEMLVTGTEPKHNWRMDIMELGDLAEKSVTGKDFDVELPFTPRMLDALANDYRDKNNAFGNIYTVLAKARPKISITELKPRVKDQLKRQAEKKIRIFDPAQQKTIDPAYDVSHKLLEVSSYLIQDGSLWKKEIRKSLDGETCTDLALICHYVIWPTRKIQKSDGAYLELEGILPNGRPMKKFVVSMKDFHKMEWLGQAWHIGAEAIEPNKEKELRNCLGMMGQNESIPEIYVCTNTGWQKDDYGVWVFLHADGGLNEDN